MIQKTGAKHQKVRFLSCPQDRSTLYFQLSRLFGFLTYLAKYFGFPARPWTCRLAGAALDKLTTLALPCPLVSRPVSRQSSLATVVFLGKTGGSVADGVGFELGCRRLIVRHRRSRHFVITFQNPFKDSASNDKRKFQLRVISKKNGNLDGLVLLATLTPTVESGHGIVPCAGLKQFGPKKYTLTICPYHSEQFRIGHHGEIKWLKHVSKQYGAF